MNIKEIEPVTVVYKELRTNLKNIGKYVGIEPNKLMQQVKEANLEVVSPQIWEYIDGNGDPEKEFTLRIGIPIPENGAQNVKNSMKLPLFKCATLEHNGSWSNLKSSYEKLISDIIANGFKLTYYCREVYHNCDFENEENNITEIQVGIE